jgi:hypothetical protein
LCRCATVGDDHRVVYAGISFEAAMTRAQAEELARLMVHARPTRPAGVVTASLELHDGVGRLVAIWQDAETLERYLTEVPVPRGTELMRKIGLEPVVERFDVLELG